MSEEHDPLTTSPENPATETSPPESPLTSEEPSRALGGAGDGGKPLPEEVEALETHPGSGTEPTAPPPEEPGEPLSPERLVDTLQQRVEELELQLEERSAQVESFKKDYARLAADFDNFRKRTNKEKEELEVKVKGKTLLDLLSVVDNFERARTQIKPADEGEMEIHKSYQGVYKTLVDCLKRLGVSPMRPEGQPFDPTYHEAMLREYTDEYPEGTVTEQLVRGYVLGEKVLRHALVKVAAPSESASSPERPAVTGDGTED